LPSDQSMPIKKPATRLTCSGDKPYSSLKIIQCPLLPRRRNAKRWTKPAVLAPKRVAIQRPLGTRQSMKGSRCRRKANMKRVYLSDPRGAIGSVSTFKGPELYQEEVSEYGRLPWRMVLDVVIYSERTRGGMRTQD